MNGCDDCRERLLDSLYDLLDADEQAALAGHLAGCAACQAALAQARQQQQLLAAAARLEFPAVRFVPPAEAPVLRPFPAPAPARAPRPWRHWAVAAGLLLALGGLTAAGLHHGGQYAQARAEVERHGQALVGAADAQRDARDALADAARERGHRLVEADRQLRARGLYAVVTGPRSVQSNAPTEYFVETSDLNGEPADATVEARLAEQPAAPDFGLALAEEGKPAAPIRVKRVAAGRYRLEVPPSLPLKPGRQLTLLVSAKREGGSSARLEDQLALTAPTFLTHLTTDKPLYQPGDPVYYRSLTLDRFSLAPAAETFALVYTLTSPRGEERVVGHGTSSLVRDDGKSPALPPLLDPDKKPVQGVGAGVFWLDAADRGGEYTLTVRDESRRFPPQSRKFLVNDYSRPRLAKKLDFSRSSYGPGDTVLAACRATRAEGTALPDRPVTATLTVDGQSYGPDGKPGDRPFTARTDADGRALVRFKLPETIERGHASLTVTFDDGAGREALVRAVPVVLKKLHVEFFPEGGDLVAGLPARVYFQARTPLGKPADLVARLVEDGQVLPGEVATLHDAKEPGVNQGTGAFTFTPRRGRKYELRVVSPAGVGGPFPLPKINDEGVVLGAARGVVAPGKPIEVTVRGTHQRPLVVGAYCRGRLLDSVRLSRARGFGEFGAVEYEATLRPAGGAGGVCRVTVFEELPTGGRRRDLKPVAERLLYVAPAERLDVDIHPDRRRYVPGQKVKLRLGTTDERERLKPAVVMVAVADKSAVTLADDKTARSMPTHFLLTSEVRKPEDLEYADFLLGPHPKAAEALDLLLGTQGWRRFAEDHPDLFRPQRPDEPDSLLLMIEQVNPDSADVGRMVAQVVGIESAFAAREGQLSEEHAEARAALVAAAGDDPAHRAALARLEHYHGLVEHARIWAVPLGVIALVLGLLLALRGLLARQLGRAWPALAGFGACAVLLGLLTQAPTPEVPTRVEGVEVTAEIDALHPLPPLVFAGKDDPEKEVGEGAVVEVGPEGAARPAPPPGVGVGGGFGGFGGPPVATALPPAPGPAPPAATQPSLPKYRPVAPLVGGAKGAPAPGKRGDDKDPKGETKELRSEVVKDQTDLGTSTTYFEKSTRSSSERPARGKAGEKKKSDEGKEEAEVTFGYGADFRSRHAQTEAQRRALTARDSKEGKGRGAGWAGATPPLVVREYAHRRSPDAAAPCGDFTETLYWHPVLVLPDGTGEATFELSESVTTFQVTAFAHTLDGRLGAATRNLEVRLPLAAHPRAPREVTAGDTVIVPLAVTNNTADDLQAALKLSKHEGLTLKKAPAAALGVRAESSARALYEFRPTLDEGEARLAFSASADGLKDAVEAKVRVVPEGFPAAGAHSDLLEGSAAHAVELPEKWVKGTLRLRAEAYPSPLADLQKGLDGLLAEPHGCFEQTSSANYPNLLVLDYLRHSGQARPEVERRARALLAAGYAKLTAFECLDPATKARRGYEWFGGTAPPHEALTAYGLMQFRDLAAVHPVDPVMVERTRQYLLKQRDGKGGFTRTRGSLATFDRAPAHVNDAYVVWSMTESGKGGDLKKELDALHAKAKASKDAYFLALVANGLVNAGRTDQGAALLKKVAGLQKADGHLDAATSITGSSGRDLQIETTALAVLGWLKAHPGAFHAPVRKAVGWIGKQRGGSGTFGSTQSTVLALKALLAYTKANKRPAESGTLKLFVGDKEMAALPFKASAADALTLELPDAERHLVPGKNKVRLEVSGKNTFPYTLSWAYRTLTPPSATGCAVRLGRSLARTALKEGDGVRLTVTLENVSGKGQGMAVGVVGLPGGLTLPEDLKQLRAHTRVPEGGGRPLVSAFEVRGRELVLYWRDLPPKAKVEVPVDLLAQYPGRYTGPASRAYLYYDADAKHWVEPLAVTVAPK